MDPTLQSLQTVQTQTHALRYVVKPWRPQRSNREQTSQLMREWRELAQKISAAWKGPRDAVQEIRDQRTKSYDPDYR